MVYFLIAILFLGVFVAYSIFFSMYVREVKKAEQHVGFRLPKILSGILKTTLTFSYVTAFLSSLYLVYITLITTRIL